MEKENKERLVKIIVSAALLAVAAVVSKIANLKMWQELLLFLVPYLIVGGETLKEAAEKLFEGELLDEDFLMSICASDSFPELKANFPRPYSSCCSSRSESYSRTWPRTGVGSQSPNLWT